MAKTQDNIDEQPQNPDLLAAVVLHVLVTEGPHGISFDEVARFCERDPEDRAEREEVQTALEILIRDELAIAQTDGPEARFEPTRAAIRADELSF